MNRRRFLELMGQSLAGAAVAYSFPSIIVPKNIVTPDGLDPLFGQRLLYPAESYYFLSADGKKIQGVGKTFCSDIQTVQTVVVERVPDWLGSGDMVVKIDSKYEGLRFKA